jgi:hypothetical protein
VFRSGQCLLPAYFSDGSRGGAVPRGTGKKPAIESKSERSYLACRRAAIGLPREKTLRFSGPASNLGPFPRSIRANKDYANAVTAVCRLAAGF